MNRKVRKMIIGGIIMHCLITPVFLRAPGIGEFKENYSVIQRIMAMWYYPLLAIFIACYLFLKRPAIILFSLIKQYIKTKRSNSRK